MKNDHKNNMHKVIMKHILILIGIGLAVGLFFLIKNFF